MIRRLSSFLLVVAVLCSCMTVTAHASEIYNPWTDIMDLATVNDAGTNYFAFNTSTSVNIDAGYESVVSYIDMVWFCGYGAPDTIYLWRSAKETARLSLNIERIGTSNFYRVYGNVGGYTLRNFKFDVTSTKAYSGTTTYRSYEIRSCRIAGSIATYPLTMSYDISPDATAEYSQNAVYEPLVDLEYGAPIPYTMEIRVEDWSLYDYLDIFISMQGSTVDSVVVEHNGRALPFTTTDHGTSYAGQTNQDLYSGVVLGDTYMMLHVDLTTIQHSSSIDPTITISGFYNTGQYASMGWNSAIGYIRDAERGGVLHWFNLAKEFLTDLLGSDGTSTDDFEDNAAQQGGEIGGLNDELENVTKPPIEDIQTDVDDYLDPDDAQEAYAVFATLTGNSLVSSMLVMALTVALVAYVLYGKR